MDIQGTMVAQVGSKEGMDHIQLAFQRGKISHNTLKYFFHKYYKEALLSYL